EGDLLDRLALRQPGDQLLGERQGDVETRALAVLLQLLDPPEEVLLGLGAEPLYAAKLVPRDRILELVDRGDTELGVQKDRFLRAQPGDTSQLADPRRHHLAELLELVHRALLRVLP